MKKVLKRRIKLANLPTPIMKLARLSAFLGGPEIYVKRDDLTGISFSGNKIRKLEYSVFQAMEEGCDMLVTCGGIQSNHARATAAVAASLGMKSHLVLAGNEPELAEGNHFLDLMFGTGITFVEEGTDLEAELPRIADDLKSKGHKPYIIPMGASNAVGSLGYVKAAKEMKKQFAETGFVPDHIVCPIGSAGTISGLAAGKARYGLKAGLHGFSVAGDRDQLMSKTKRLFMEIADSYFPDLVSQTPDIHIIDSYVGEGYTKTDRSQLEFIKKVASMEGLLLDPTYTGKAMYGMAEEISGGTFSKDEKLLFIHTGGVFGLFPYREMIQKRYGLIG